jgi:hypothetical protein
LQELPGQPPALLNALLQGVAVPQQMPQLRHDALLLG